MAIDSGIVRKYQLHADRACVVDEAPDRRPTVSSVDSEMGTPRKVLLKEGRPVREEYVEVERREMRQTRARVSPRMH